MLFIIMQFHPFNIILTLLTDVSWKPSSTFTQESTVIIFALSTISAGAVGTVVNTFEIKIVANVILNNL